MAALERYFLSKGYRVAGYDRTETELTRQLAKEGVEITYNDTVDAIPADFRDCPQQVQVVYTPALPSDHPQLSYFRSQGYPVLKRSQVLGLITKAANRFALPAHTARHNVINGCTPAEHVARGVQRISWRHTA